MTPIVSPTATPTAAPSSPVSTVPTSSPTESPLASPPVPPTSHRLLPVHFIYRFVHLAVDSVFPVGHVLTVHQGCCYVKVRRIMIIRGKVEIEGSKRSHYGEEGQQSPTPAMVVQGETSGSGDQRGESMNT
ncbi:hypothetical protein L1887_32894 [Cichorium endivia]|nr:hypothetical protein L1887_32894 [Cichorium endivia]